MEPVVDLVSIIIPVYNGETTIAETLCSVFAQTHDHLEILVIDDGSTDRTAAIVERMDDPRLTLHRFENGGAHVSRNRGIERARGDLLSFLDADDLWHPAKIASQVAALEAMPEAGVAYSFCRYIDDRGNELHRGLQEPHQGNVLPQLFVSFFLQNGSNALIRRQVIERIGGFDESLEVCDDYDFYLRAAEHFSFAVDAAHHVAYRVHAGSLSSQPARMRRASHWVIHRAAARQPELLGPLLRESIAATDGYIFGKVLSNPRDWRGLVLCVRCLWSHVRAGRAGFRLLAARFGRFGYWLKRIVTWVVVPRRFRADPYRTLAPPREHRRDGAAP